jgi:regulatory protein
MAVKSRRHKGARPPLDGEALERLALAYAGRFATTRAKLASYLERKLAERGWADASAPPVARLVARFAELGYVDDRAFAEAKAASLGRRGYGARRVAAALKAAGVEEEDGADARAAARAEAEAAALRFARRRRIGPFADAAPDPAGREKAFAALVRAGHDIDLARKLVRMPPGTVPEEDI